MATKRGIYKSHRGFKPGQGLPTISKDLDSVRAYQIEVHFQSLDPVSDFKEALTLAAKQVSPLGMTADDIPVDRVNDKVFYPGKVTPVEATITFDNLYKADVAGSLWSWFGSVYDPITGEFDSGADDYKANRMEIIHLDNLMTPLASTSLYGVYPKSWKTSEFNYSTNEFHTLEVVFRYDFMQHDGHQNNAIGS